MKLLLDTHIFLWYITGNRELIQAFARRSRFPMWCMSASFRSWKATIKYQLGKLPLPQPAHPWLSIQREHHGFASLVIDEGSTGRLSNLRSHHRDPFDRMLVCQAIQHNLVLVSADPAMTSYDVELLRPD